MDGKTTKIFLYGLGVLGIFVIATILVMGIGSVDENSNRSNEINSTRSTQSLMATHANGSLNNKGLIFKIGDDKGYASYGFKGNISAGETIDYIFNISGWEDVAIRFYSDNEIDIGIIEKDIKGVVGTVENSFENIKKKDYKIKGGMDIVKISIKGKKNAKYGILVIGAKKKNDDEKSVSK